MSFTAGQMIGPYRIIEQLGQGGMATVFKAYHASLDRYVAIKVLHQAFLEDKTFLARFQREARLVARLEHPNIVPIYDYAEHSGQPYLVMKYIEGDTLKARLHAGLLGREEVSEIIERVGAGLAYAHKQGILHRDIKPSNVILANDGGIYLADFGLARIAQSGDSTLTSDMILGTPQYISPEQALGKSDLDQGTDIYSFGVMVYEMTTGRVPFSADTPFSVIHDHIYSPLPLPTQVNPNLSMDIERVLLKSLAKDRADRYSDVSIFVGEFLAAWQNEVKPNALTQTRAAAPAEFARAAGTSATHLPEANQIVMEVVQQNDKTAHPGPAKRRRWWPWILVGSLVFLCLCCLLIGILNDEEIKAGRQETPSEPVATPLVQQEELEQAEAVPLSALPVEQASQAVEADPESPIAHVELGLALIGSGNEIEGYAEIRLGAELSRSDPSLLLGLAKALEKREHWPGALTMYLRLHEVRPRLPQLIENLRRAAYYSASHPLAPEIIELESVGNVDQPALLMAQARYVILHRQDFEEARRLLAEIRLPVRNFPERALVEAEGLYLAGQHEEALQALNTILEQDEAPSWVRDQAERLLKEFSQ
jgi:tRNA A-37 threonylcarbamoyl transferase component Bud32/tetratricopeptide (TPR) repeat protein